MSVLGVMSVLGRFWATCRILYGVDHGNFYTWEVGGLGSFWVIKGPFGFLRVLPHK